MEAGKWCWSSDEEYFNGEFDSKDAALLDGFMDNPDYQTLWVGRVKEVDIRRLVDARCALDGIVESVLEESPEVAHDHGWGGAFLPIWKTGKSLRASYPNLLWKLNRQPGLK